MLRGLGRLREEDEGEDGDGGEGEGEARTGFLDCVEALLVAMTP